jgi:hypothetical protein
LSTKYPVYVKGGIRITIQIKSGTTITEQIAIERMDLSHITLTSEDAFVNVNSSGWTGITHDSRGSTPFISGEYGAKLPTIGTIFKYAGGNGIALGYFCNRGSMGLVESNCGFDGFYDNILANNESSITIREGVAKNATRWGLHSRHNGEISARSVDISGCGIAAYSDRIADLDIRMANLDGSDIAIQCFNASRINANGATANNTTNTGYIVQSTEGSLINCSEMTIGNPLGSIFSVSNGGTITAFNTIISGILGGKNQFSQTKNTLTHNGVIYSNP